MGIKDEKTFGDSQSNSKNGTSTGSLWANEYKNWKDAKDGKTDTSGFGGSTMDGNGWSASYSSSSSSPSSNRLDWDKMVNGVFKDRQDKK